jgi:dCMP deaminase
MHLEECSALSPRLMKFYPVAEAFAGMSKDPSTKVGAIALDDDFNIVSAGYNGFPRGVRDDASRYLDRETKLKLISHAEANLVAQAAHGGRSLKGTSVIVTSLPPCSACAKLLVQAGVSRVISVHPDAHPRWADEAALASLIFNEAGVLHLYLP